MIDSHGGGTLVSMKLVPPEQTLYEPEIEGIPNGGV